MKLFRKLFGEKEEVKVRHSTKNYCHYFESNEINGTKLEVLQLGELMVPTGNIIACDPLAYYYNSQPFNKTIKPGKYPVTICIAKMEESGDRYALAKLEFSNEKPTQFELAVINGQNISELKDPDEFFGFPVDAGLGCFMDVQTQLAYKEFDDSFYRKNPNGNIYHDFFASEFKKNATSPNEDGDWINFQFPNSADLNIIMFHSGYGDGVYPAYWGTNEKGDIVNLIIDFCLL